MTFSPSAGGQVTITVTLNYLDDLNRAQTMIKSYTTQGVVPPPPPTPIPVISTPTAPQQPSSSDVGQRIMFGLLGLGS